jgi:pyridoxal phosphate enzyme (YggS family)
MSDLPSHSQLKTNYVAVQQQIETVCRSVNRDASSVRLVAVSKTKPSSDIQALYDLGHRHFGENYVKELEEKANFFKELGHEIRWHFIGHLQANKCRNLVRTPGLFLVETVDSEKIATELNKQLHRAVSEELKVLVPLKVLIQCNVSQEPSKGGVTTTEEMFKLVRYINDSMKCLKFTGLMCIGEPGQGHRDYETLTKWAALLQNEFPMADSLELSMGMSDDFEAAIEKGSSSIRVGSMIFGSRKV